MADPRYYSATSGDRPVSGRRDDYEQALRDVGLIR